jgi:hypothetical protein
LGTAADSNKPFSLSLALIERRADTSTDLSLLLSPAYWLPLKHKITESFDPFIGRALLAPAVEQIHAAFRVNPNHEMNGVIAAVSCDGRVRTPLDAQAGSLSHDFNQAALK